MAKEVLLAHADSAIQELATRTLSMLGIHVDIAPDPADAAARIRQNHYGVVVVDGRPAEVFQALGELPPPHPQVIVTAENRDDVVDPADPQLVTMVVPPPYDAQTLVGVIVACVNEHPWT